MNPLKTFLTNLQNNPVKTATGLLGAVAILLGYFGVVIPEDWKTSVAQIAGFVATAIVMFQPQKQ